jgi:NNP family nitrate/nitrite transporter-like MFS transporter
VKLTELRRSGHWPMLLAAFVYFDVNFAVGYVLGPLANFIADDLALTVAQKGMLVATPLLGGSLCRIVMGFLTDYLGPRRAGLLGITLTFLPLMLGRLVADSYQPLLLVTVVSVCGMSLLLAVKSMWQLTWAAALPTFAPRARATN